MGPNEFPHGNAMNEKRKLSPIFGINHVRQTPSKRKKVKRNKYIQTNEVRARREIWREWCHGIQERKKRSTVSQR